MVQAMYLDFCNDEIGVVITETVISISCDNKNLCQFIFLTREREIFLPLHERIKQSLINNLR